MSDGFSFGATTDNVVFTRPTDTRVVGVQRTWAKNCTNPSIKDGTKLDAGWVNEIKANAETLVTGAGLALDGTDDQWLRAVQSITNSNAIAGGTTDQVLTSQGSNAPIWKYPHIVNSVYAEYTTSTALSNSIAIDSTVPLNTEGTQVLSVSITPKAMAHKLRVRFITHVSHSTGSGGGSGVAAAIFQNGVNIGSGCNYAGVDVYAHSIIGMIAIEAEVAASAGANIITARVGNCSINAIGGEKTTLIVEEIVA